MRQKKDFSCMQSDGDDSETGKRNVFIQKQHDPAAMLVGVSAPVGDQALINSIKKKKNV